MGWLWCSGQSQCLGINGTNPALLMWISFITLLVALVYYIVHYFMFVVEYPQVFYNKQQSSTRNGLNLDRVLARCHTLRQQYFPTIWCTNRHLQIVFMMFRRLFSARHEHIKPKFREFLTHTDGGATALDWHIPV